VPQFSGGVEYFLFPQRRFFKNAKFEKRIARINDDVHGANLEKEK
jgi:hypothetical protein